MLRDSGTAPGGDPRDPGDTHGQEDPEGGDAGVRDRQQPGHPGRQQSVQNGHEEVPRRRRQRDLVESAKLVESARRNWKRGIAFVTVRPVFPLLRPVTHCYARYVARSDPLG